MHNDSTHVFFKICFASFHDFSRQVCWWPFWDVTSRDLLVDVEGCYATTVTRSPHENRGPFIGLSYDSPKNRIGSGINKPTIDIYQSTIIYHPQYLDSPNGSPWNQGDSKRRFRWLFLREPVASCVLSVTRMDKEQIAPTQHLQQLQFLRFTRDFSFIVCWWLASF